MVAAYNHARYVVGALNSVLAQTTPPDRLIITDDASSDTTVSAIEGWLKQTGADAKTIFHPQNRGICATFNEALAHVTTDVVTFMSADDEMIDNRLQRQLDRFVGAPETTAAVYSDAVVIDEAGRPTGRLFSDGYRFAGQSLPEGNLFQDLCGGNWIPAPTVLLRTAAVREVGGYDEALAVEDYDLWLRLSRRFDFARVDEPLIRYREHPSSLTVKLSRERVIGLDLCKSRLKHVGHSETTDAIILDEASGRLHHLYLSGSDPATVAGPLRIIARRRPTLTHLALATAASLGLRVRRSTRRRGSR